MNYAAIVAGTKTYEEGLNNIIYSSQEPIAPEVRDALEAMLFTTARLINVAKKQEPEALQGRADG